MRSRSPKLDFLTASIEEQQDYFENLIKVDKTDYEPGPTGTKIHLCPARTQVIVGGLGSGKTRCAGEDLYADALAHPGSKHIIARRDLTSLKATTQSEFLEHVVAPETVRGFNVNDNNLYLKNSAIIMFRELKDLKKFKSYEVATILIDESDENEDPKTWSTMNQRLRQKIWLPDGELVIPQFKIRLVLNPPEEGPDHWIIQLGQRKDLDVAYFTISTYENEKNLPPGYIAELKLTLSPTDQQRLIDGLVVKAPGGRPVIHGFTMDRHVYPLQLQPHLPLLIGQDFGFNRPALRFSQLDPMTGRYFILREFLGHEQYLRAGDDGRTPNGKPSVVSELRRIVREILGPSIPVFRILYYCDPHGADKKDNALSSVETLRVHESIHPIYRRTEIKTGLDEIQHKVSHDGPSWLDHEQPKRPEDKPVMRPLFIVDPSCKYTIDGYLGQYYRGSDGLPVKDGLFDHLPDTDRYVLVNNMNAHLAMRLQQKARSYRPRCSVTGY